MISKIYSNQGFRSRGGAFTCFPGGPSGFITNDVTDGVFGADINFATGYFNRATENTAQPSFQTSFAAPATASLAFNSQSQGFALESVSMRSLGQEAYVYFNDLTPGLSGFRMVSNTEYNFDGPITQIALYSSVPGTPVQIIGIPVKRP